MGTVIYLHGRGESPTSPPGDIVRAAPWSVRLFAPSLGARWLAGPFDRQVRTVDEWLDASRLAIGHSYGGWLLLCAAHDRVVRGATLPRMLLLSCMLGVGGCGRVSMIAPRSRSVRAALGLSPDRGQPLLPRAALTFVHGADDDQSRPDVVERLSRNFHVDVVPGGHRLDHPAARDAVWTTLRRMREALTV